MPRTAGNAYIEGRGGARLPDGDWTPQRSQAAPTPFRARRPGERGPARGGRALTRPSHRLRRGIASVCLSGGLTEKLTAAAEAGFDMVELFEPDVVGSFSQPEPIRELAAELGISLDVYQPLRDFEAVSESRLQANLRRAEQKLRLMERLGASTLVACSNTSADAIDDDELAAEQLRRLAEAAASHGFRVAYEALSWGTHVNDYRRAHRLVALAGHPALGLCLDSFHILAARSDLSDLAGIPASRIFMLQLADAPKLPMAPLQWSRHHRCFPGQGELDVAEVVRQVLRTGYAGALSLEVFNDTFRQVPSRRAAIDGMRSLLALEEFLGLTALPPNAQLGGFAFAELSGEEDVNGRSAALLAGLGFEVAGRHRSKPVELWQQGNARVLLNVGSPRIAALAVESADPELSAERAIGLRAPERSRVVGPGEVEMTEVEAPDGTSVFFCRSDGSLRSWLHDFLPMKDPTSHPAGLLGIDHVGLVQPFGHFDEAVLFWRSVLGLVVAEGRELASPDGLLRGCALTDPKGSLVLDLSGPLLGAGEITPYEIQHIAFRTVDIFATAKAMRSFAGGVLRIPDNYYEDLDSRFELDPVLFAAMRVDSILYDRDTSGGELLHFYTTSVGNSFCFEVLERRHGYVGLGVANAPVRLAAQAAVSDAL